MTIIEDFSESDIRYVTYRTFQRKGCQVQKMKGTNLAISFYRKGQILKNVKRPFSSTFKKAKNGKMAKSFHFWQKISKRPNGNPAQKCCYIGVRLSSLLLLLLLLRLCTAMYCCCCCCAQHYLKVIICF